MDDLLNLVSASCSYVEITRFFLRQIFLLSHVILISINFFFSVVQKHNKMKHTTGSLESLFILIKCLGMASSQIIHRDASRMDCGNSFVLNNFSLFICGSSDKQIDLQSLSACINHICCRFEALRHSAKESQFIIQDQDTEMNVLSSLPSFTHTSHSTPSSIQYWRNTVVPPPPPAGPQPPTILKKSSSYPSRLK